MDWHAIHELAMQGLLFVIVLALIFIFAMLIIDCLVDK